MGIDDFEPTVFTEAALSGASMLGGVSKKLGESFSAEENEKKIVRAIAQCISSSVWLGIQLGSFCESASNEEVLKSNPLEGMSFVQDMATAIGLASFKKMLGIECNDDHREYTRQLAYEADKVRERLRNDRSEVFDLDMDELVDEVCKKMGYDAANRLLKEITGMSVDEIKLRYGSKAKSPKGKTESCDDGDAILDMLKMYKKGEK